MKENKNTRKYSSYLFDLILELQMNPKSFAESLGFNRADRIYNVLKGLNGISSDLAKIISEKYSNVNYEWLLTGEGEMLNDIKQVKLKPEESLLEQGIGVIDKSKPLDSVTPVPFDNYMMVEFTDLSTAAGPLGGTNVNDLPKTKTRLVPKEFDNGDYLVTTVDGDSMDDGTKFSIPNGTEILIKRLHLNNGDTLPIRNNLFVINAYSGAALKQITEYNTKEGYLRCHSYNPDFEDYIVPFDELIEIFIYRKIVSSRPPIPDIKL